MILNSPKLEKLITPGIRQRISQKCRKFLVHFGILSPYWYHCTDTMHRSLKRRNINSLLQKLWIICKVR